MTPEPQKPADSRRRHKKSRNGCLVCKQRRVKCDEVRPQCGKCVFGKRPCSWRDQSPPSSGHLTPAGPATTPEFTSILAAQAGAHPGLCAPDAADRHFTAFDMALLYHATTSMDGYIGGLDNHAQLFISNALEAAHVAPYLLNQLLALSALHLSVTNPETAAILQQQAATLQNRAVALFNESDEHVDANYKAAFLFASLLGVHVLRNTLADHIQSLGAFVGGFVKYARIQRGIRAVINRRWKDLMASELRPLLLMADELDGLELPKGSETAGLRRHLESTAGFSTSSVTACLEALEWIQRLLDIVDRKPAASHTTHHQIAWTVLISEEYIEVLYQRRPEALVVLACFAAMLHRDRHFWVFGDSGAILFEMIAAHLGPFWSDALAWPRHVISGGGKYNGPGHLEVPAKE